MFVYDKKLQYPVKIEKPNPKLASIIISQYWEPPCVTFRSGTPCLLMS